MGGQVAKWPGLSHGPQGVKHCPITDSQLSNCVQLSGEESNLQTLVNMF
jgi:hypothetical protein